MPSFLPYTYAYPGDTLLHPTETVYGLGAHALNVTAVHHIFTAKGRPLSDPLIVHVLDAAAAQAIVQTDDKTKPLFECLTSAFWPGPLTLVLAAQPVVPGAISANTGFVGVRAPAHPVARRLLEVSGLPVAAPSANRFGHVSPTAAIHVLHDLGAQDIDIVNGDGSIPAESGEVQVDPAYATARCDIGIESTVVKVHPNGQELTVYRRGGVSLDDIQRAMDSAGLHPTVHIAAKEVKMQHEQPGAAAPATLPATEEQGLEAPGQLLTHYAPDVPAYMLPRLGAGEAVPADVLRAAEHAAVLDFGGAYAGLRSIAPAYNDLSSSGNVEEARAGVFAALRWTEEVAAAAAPGTIQLSMVPVHALDDDSEHVHAGAEHAAALRDRLFRSASGRPLAEWTVPE